MKSEARLGDNAARRTPGSEPDPEDAVRGAMQLTVGRAADSDARAHMVNRSAG